MARITEKQFVKDTTKFRFSVCPKKLCSSCIFISVDGISFKIQFYFLIVAPHWYFAILSNPSKKDNINFYSTSTFCYFLSCDCCFYIRAIVGLYLSTGEAKCG